MVARVYATRARSLEREPQLMEQHDCYLLYRYTAR